MTEFIPQPNCIETIYVLFIEFADDPPRVGVFDTFDDAENFLDAFQVTVFDPPQNNDLLDLQHTFRARIFECNRCGPSLAFNYQSGDGSGWGTEIDVNAARKKMYAQIRAGASVEQNEMDDEERRLEWKQVGDRWIAYDCEDEGYEVSKNAHGWECAWMMHKIPVAKITVATFEQAKQVAKRHSDTGGWANMTPSETHCAFFGGGK